MKYLMHNETEMNEGLAKNRGTYLLYLVPKPEKHGSSIKQDVEWFSEWAEKNKGTPELDDALGSLEIGLPLVFEFETEEELRKGYRGVFPMDAGMGSTYAMGISPVSGRLFENT